MNLLYIAKLKSTNNLWYKIHIWFDFLFAYIIVPYLYIKS